MANVPAVDIDDESILSSVFKDKFNDEDRRNPEFLLFLSRLSSYGIHKLNLEPSRLASEKFRILEQTQELAFHNYKTFIRTAKCSKDIFQDFSVIENRLQSMLAKLPMLSEHGQSFTKKAASISAIRHSNSLTLTRHTELLEILEIPQLMDTCVRNQYYEDALELMFYVKRLDKKTFIAEIPVIASVIKDVQQSAQLMLEQLLAQLRTAIQLPTCLKIVGFLRRLECFTETELRLRFLQARNYWLESLLSPVVSPDAESDAYDRTTRTVEIYRVHLFDIVTQYRAIFSDDMNVLYNDGVSKQIDNSPYDASIFHCWLVYRIDFFLRLLETCLDSGVGNRLDSVLGQCMYFGQSFSRVGADFRSLLLPIFQKAIKASISQLLEQTTKEFEATMMSYSLLSTSISYNQVNPTGFLSTSSGSNVVPQPPISLLDFPPLAAYVNGVSTAFNQVRSCCPFSMAIILPSLLLASLKQVASVIVAYHSAEEPAFSDSERVSFVRFCSAFIDDVLPHIQACAHLIIQHHSISDVYGSIHLPSYQAKEAVFGLDEICSILQPCLPKKVTFEPPSSPKGSIEEGLDTAKKTIETAAVDESVKPLRSVSSNATEISDDAHSDADLHEQ